MRYKNSKSPASEHSRIKASVIINLGTPESCDTASVRRFLAEFLSDPRVVEKPRWLWWILLHAIILRVRPARSAKLYAKIWEKDGSPLLSFSKKLCASVNQLLPKDVQCYLAMSYQQPSITSLFDTLSELGITDLVILPLYPQYSATTSASVFDAISNQLRTWRRVPKLHFIDSYYNHPGYIAAIAKSITQFQATQGMPDRLMFSFHGLPQKYIDCHDPYTMECQQTAKLVAEKLELGQEQWSLSFQSRVGVEAWIQPYTDQLLAQWAEQGIKRIHVICPGFSVDCLETLEEISITNRALFLAAGGESLKYIPALNDNPAHAQLISDLINQPFS